MPEGQVAQLSETPDVAVIGAGSMGGWTALRLLERGARVHVYESWAPGNSRSSSGDESRIIRAGYGKDEIYTRWAWRALALWKQYEGAWGQTLFEKTGVLWLAREEGHFETLTFEELQRQKIPAERLSADQLAARYPQFSFEGISFGVFEPEAGALFARRACQAVIDAVRRANGVFRIETIRGPEALGAGTNRLEELRTITGKTVRADQYVFACGPWLPKLFPELLGSRVRVTKQDVFFFGSSAADDRFRLPRMPVWIDLSTMVYGYPPLDGRGLKLALDAYGPVFDPDVDDRLASEETLRSVRQYLAQRFPDLRDAPIEETRVCQYESTTNEHYILDRHPKWKNVWILGGGSGHAFKMGPALGEYAAEQILGIAKEPVLERFQLAAGARHESYRTR